MFIRKLRPNEPVPSDYDRICIGRHSDGVMTWNGFVNVEGTALHGAGRGKYTTIREAETDAIEWARRQGASLLIIDASGV